MFVEDGSVKPEPFTLDGDDPLYQAERARNLKQSTMDSAQGFLFSPHIDRKPSRKSAISEPSLFDWLDTSGGS